MHFGTELLSFRIRRSGRCSLWGCFLSRLCLFFFFVLFGLILAFINEFEDTFFVFLSELAVDFSSLLRIGHNNLIDNELLNNILVNGILFELKVIVSYWLTFDDLVIVEGIIELLQEWVLKYLFSSESFLGIVGH